jgi:hypothetical protein
MENKVNQNIIGLNLDSINWQVKENQITWALNANVQSHDGNSITYTNEPGNTECYTFDTGNLAGFVVVGFLNIVEQSKVVLFLSHPDGRSRIGSITSINDSCLDIEITEKDCGCKEGTIIQEATVVESLPEPVTTLVCPEGFTFNPDTLQCEQLSYTVINENGITYNAIESCVNGSPCGVVSTHGCLLPKVYASNWTTLTPPDYASIATELTQQFWIPNDTLPPDPIFNNSTYVKTIAVQADLDPTNVSCRTCHTIPTTSVIPSGWIGFAETVCITQTKEYFLAVSADDSLRVFIDGVIVLDIDANDPTKRLYNAAPPLGGDNGSTMWSRLNIFPITITSGSHVFRFEYKNTAGIGMFAYELYDMTLAELLSVSSEVNLRSKIVLSNGKQISSKPKRPISAGGEGAAFIELTNACPDGYELVVDENCAPICRAILETERIAVSGIATCCKYEDIIVDDCLDECPNSCVEYVLDYVADAVYSNPAITDPQASIPKYFRYIDCDGNPVTDSILTTSKRFTARRGTLELDSIYLAIVQESSVPDSTTGTFAKTNCCLNFDPAFPVNAEYRIDDCETKVYYISRNNPPRYFSTLYPYGKDSCGNNRSCIKESCEDSKLFPDFCIPETHITAVTSGGQLAAGMYSFAVAYADEGGIELTDYSDLTNGIPIFERAISEQTEYVTAKSINVQINHKTRIFEYFNLIVAENINTTTTYHLVGTFRVNQYTDQDSVIYTGDYKSTFSSIVPLIRSPHYETANIIEKQNDILMLADLEEYPKFNFQPFASRIKLLWETVEMPADGQFDYSNPEISYFFRTYQRDEVYPFGIKFRLKNGKYTDVFHIPGRLVTGNDLDVEYSATNKDVFVGETDCTIPTELPRWKVYNTAGIGSSVPLDPAQATDVEKQYSCAITVKHRGEFAYWESTETYPCYDEVWGQSKNPNAPYYDPEALGGKPIRHHKFPDSAVTHIHDNKIASGGQFSAAVTNDSKTYLYPIGVRVDEAVIVSLLNQKNPDGTYAYTVYDPIRRIDVPVKDVVCGFELVRGNRVGNKSVIAKGLMYDVGTYEDNSGDGPIKKYYYSNYPYNDLRTDPYLMNDNRWYNEPMKTLLFEDPTTVGAVGGFSTVPIIGNNRFTFYSPDTSFQYPKIGTELKVETVEFGRVLGHFVPVAEHPRYRLLQDSAYFDAGAVAGLLSFEYEGKSGVDATVTGGVKSEGGIKIRYDQLLINEQLILDILEKVIPFVNFAYQYNSIATYNQYVAVGSTTHKGNTRRYIDLGYYANERIVQVFDDAPLHNRLRETSVYLKLRDYIQNLESQLIDDSRYIGSDHGDAVEVLHDKRFTRAYYTSIKRQFPNQYGIVDNLKYVSIGQTKDIILRTDGTAELSFNYYPAFGGDTFITPFALKRKHAFFTRNLVNLPAKQDGMPFDYWLSPNMGYPKYFLGTSSNINNLTGMDIVFGVAGVVAGIAASALGSSAAGIVLVASSIVANQLTMFGINSVWSKFSSKTALDGASTSFANRYFKDGRFYTASYGIPIFYVESDINTHFRFGRDTDKENFYPNVGGGVPDEWLQETTVPIRFDNFYHYNGTYSAQNLSPNFPYRLKYPNLECLVNHQNRVIYSDQASKSNLLSDKWLSYRPGNYYDFPKQGGRLIDLNAGESEKVYARFENTTKVYNARIVLSSTSPYQLEIGNADMFKQKPVDLSTTDLGYIGSQHKAYVRTEYGTFWVDAKRGHVYQITGAGFNEIKSELNFNWFKENLPFQILKDFPEADTDVPSLGLGIVMGWDERFERVFITKLDYRVLPAYRTGTTTIEYITDRLDINYRYYVLKTPTAVTRVRLGNPVYFENKSWTVAYAPKLKNFISFYSFLPNFFISQLGHFQTIVNTPAGASLWNHNLNPYIYQTYYGKLYPYIIEYVVNSLPMQSTVTSVTILSDILEYYSKYEYYSLGTSNNTNLANFNKAIIYNREQSSGLINLIPETFGNTKQKIMYPRMTTSGIESLLSRREGRSTFNGFWNIAAQGNGQSLWTNQWTDLSANYPIDKLPNMKAIRNVGLSYQKNKIKSDFTRVRLIQDKYNRYKFVNNIQINQTNQTAL